MNFASDADVSRSPKWLRSDATALSRDLATAIKLVAKWFLCGQRWIGRAKLF